MKKKYVAVILTIIMILTCTVSVTANTVRSMSDDGDITVYIEGRYFCPNPDEGYEVVIKDDRTFLPIRYVAETLNYQVNWDQDTQGITMTSGDTTVNMNVGNSNYTVNGEQKTMDTEPFIRSDRTYVPLRFAAEAFGENVQWDNNNRTAIIGSYSDHDLNYSSGTTVELKKAGIYIMIDEVALDGLVIEDNELGTEIFDKASYDAYKADGSEGGWIVTIYRQDYPDVDMYTQGMLLDYVDGVYIQAQLPSDVQAYLVEGKEQPYMEKYSANYDMVKECLKHIMLIDSNDSNTGGSDKYNGDPSDGREEMIYMSSDGFQIRYNARTVESMEIDEHTAQFVYIGESAGSNMVIVSYIADKQPEEALYELTSSWGDQESISRREGFLPGTDDKWGYWRTLITADSGSGIGESAIAGEYNGGTIMFEILSHMSGDDKTDMAVSDALSEIINSITYDNFEPQTMYSYYAGTYTAGKGKLTLKEDHHGVLSFQDDVDVLWGSNYITATDSSFTYDFNIEGDNLYLDYDGNMLEFKRQ